MSSVSGFCYNEGHLGVTNGAKWVSLSDFLPEGPLEVPRYIYNLSSIAERVRAYQGSIAVEHKIHYAVKANSHPRILKLIKDLGCGVDVVSLGEVKRSLEIGFSPQDIIFSGVAKSHSDLRFAVENKIFQINVESIDELKRVAETAKSLGTKAHIGLRINPDISVETHPYISTGFRENKFGISFDQVSSAINVVKSNSSHLKLTALSAHIGSQIMDMSPLYESSLSLLKVYRELLAMGFELTHVDVGGGVGVDYSNRDEIQDLENIERYGAKLSDIFRDFGGALQLEPGRSLVARSGALITQVEYVKHNGFKNFIIVNTGMHHLLRPSLYSAFHQILPMVKDPTAPKAPFDVVGPICESSDVLGRDRIMSIPKERDLLVVLDAGAYGMSMASQYNLHSLPEETILGADLKII